MFSDLIYHVLAIICLASISSQSTSSFPHRYPVRQYQETDTLGAVASESSVCSRIGVSLIQAGGNAADAVSLSTPISLHETA